jgi:hypothetical protein
VRKRRGERRRLEPKPRSEAQSRSKVTRDERERERGEHVSCSEHEEIKQSRRHDATETFPITSYKVDMKIRLRHSLCNCYLELKKLKHSEA